MERTDDLIFRTVDACGCGETGLDEQQNGYDCARRATVFTHREEQILRRIRELSAKARELKWRIKHLSAAAIEPSPERMRVFHELEDIRRVRAELEKERLAAAEERMRLLGHI